MLELGSWLGVIGGSAVVVPFVVSLVVPPVADGSVPVAAETMSPRLPLVVEPAPESVFVAAGGPVVSVPGSLWTGAEELVAGACVPPGVPGVGVVEDEVVG